MDQSSRTGAIAYLASATVTTAIGALFFWQSFQIGEVQGVDSLGSRGLPMLLSALLILLGVALLAQTLLRARRTSLAFDMEGVGFCLTILVALGAYVYVLEILGFLVSTTLFCGIAFKLVAGDRLLKAGGKALTVTAAFIVVFNYMLQIQLPAGVLRGVL